MLSACQSAAGRPAMLTSPTPQVISELAHIVSGALGGQHVILAPDALTDSSVLIIEPAPHRSMQGRLGSDRSKAAPDRFHLVSHHDKCILIQDATGKAFKLPHAECTPIKP